MDECDIYSLYERIQNSKIEGAIYGLEKLITKSSIQNMAFVPPSTIDSNESSRKKLLVSAQFFALYPPF
jgi:hypothetical protein